MNNFATSNITTADGRRNKEPVPAEIFARGFVPPVQTPDGVWQAGDELPANWLNYLLNDLYKGAVTRDVTPATAPANQLNYFAVQIGDMMIQGGYFTPSDTTSTSPRLMPYPIPFQVGSAPVVFGMRSQSQTVPAPFVSSMDATAPDTAATAILWTATINGSAVATTPLYWVAVGHTAANVNQVPQGYQDLRANLEFCETAMTYPDGQENVGQPGTITVAQGFAPPINNNGVWSEGDGLSAQAVNFLLRDLYRMPKYQGIAGGHARSGAIEFGGYLIQWAIVGSTNNAANVTFPIPFANSDPSVVAFDVQGYNATPPAGEQCFAATRNITATGCDIFLTGGTVTGGNGIVKTPASLMFIASGLSSRQTAPTGDDNMVLSSFAATNVTYPDGQANKVSPSTAQVNDGFTFETAAAPGDFLSANKINFLINDLYKQLNFLIERIYFQPPGYVGPYPQMRFRLGNMMIQSGRVRMADLVGTGGKVVWRDAFKAPPAVMFTQRYDNNVPALGAASVARHMSAVAVTATDATVQPRDAAGNAAGNATNNNFTFDWIAFGLAPDA